MRHNAAVQPEQGRDGFVILAVSFTDGVVCLEASGAADDAACPSCGAVAWQVHDR